MRELLYNKHQLEHEVPFQHAIQRLVDQRNRFLQNGAHPEGGGVPIRFKKNQSIHLSLSVAVLQLLRLLHAEGWVHGDSHLGNFIYCDDGRMYAIDFERSFRTRDTVQHLLDIQEAFGHISGIMINIHNQNEWDMRDLPGIHFHRSPPLTCPLCI